MALGVSLGVSFPRLGNVRPLDLLSIAQSQMRAEVPEDVVDEVFDAIKPANRPQEGDWILINGGMGFPVISILQDLVPKV